MMRHVFWRSPDGRPYRGADGKYAPVALLADIGKQASISESGHITYRGFGPHSHELAISWCSAVLQPDGSELGAADTERIMHGAMNSCIKRAGGGKPILPNDVLREADALAANHFQLPPKTYHIITTISLETFPTRYAILNDAQVRPIGVSNRFRHAFADSELNLPAFLQNHVDSTAYKPIQVTTSARCSHEAMEKASNALHLLRGLWTLFATYGQASVHFGNRQQVPLGVIQLGPLKVLFDEGGNKIKGGAWYYDPSYSQDSKLFRPRGGWEAIENRRRWALARLQKLPYRVDLEHLIIRYVTALDEQDLDIAFLHLWSTLEKLTDTIGKNYDATIERAARPFANRKAIKEKLTALRLRRNQLVHSAKSGDDRDQIIYMIKAYLEPHLLALLRNDFAVSSFAEFVEFLSLPTEEQLLVRRHRQLGRMLRMMKK